MIEYDNNDSTTHCRYWTFIQGSGLVVGRKRLLKLLPAKNYNDRCDNDDYLIYCRYRVVEDIRLQRLFLAAFWLHFSCIYDSIALPTFVMDSKYIYLRQYISTYFRYCCKKCEWNQNNIRAIYIVLAYNVSIYYIIKIINNIKGEIIRPN